MVSLVRVLLYSNTHKHDEFIQNTDTHTHTHAHTHTHIHVHTHTHTHTQLIRPA
jgi:hypothetical protein